MQHPIPTNATPPSTRSAWVSAIGVWLLGCVLLGLGCFVVVGGQLRMMTDKLWSAVYWQLCFAIALAIVLAAVIVANRVQGTTLADIGWRKPTSSTAIVFGVILGGLYVAGVYAGILNDPSMKHMNPFAMHWVRFALIPLGVFMAIAEEVVMRGFFMTQLSHACVPAWAQILLSGACSAAYHSFHNFTWIGFIPSFVLFSLHAVLFVAGQRSLTPSIVAHSMYHVLCAPYLLMFAMAQSSA
jgi:membrane protease YdiL (CAAX protease family)